MSLESPDFLRETFRKLGCPDPDREVKISGSRRLMSYLFARSAVDLMVAADAGSWVAELASRHFGPRAGVTRKLLEDGAKPADLARFVRLMQEDLLGSIAYLLSDSGSVPWEKLGLQRDDFWDVGWGFWSDDLTDEDPRPIAREGGLNTVMGDVIAHVDRELSGAPSEPGD